MSLSEEARLFAAAHRVGRLATADAAGRPHLVPICYAVDGDSLYFVVDEKPKRSRTGLRRLRNLAANPRAAVLVDEYDEDWSRLAYLLLEGRAETVGDRREYERALSLLRARYPQYRDMRLEFETHPMVRIRIERAHVWRARWVPA